MSQPFLRSLARAYTSKYKDLKNLMFVFPNRRACTFFLKELTQCIGAESVVLPQVTTMSDMVEMLCGRVVAGKIELLFILYKTYASHLRKEGIKDIPPFDHFRKWGETALSDFNEVDMQDADADALFKNVRDVKEISSNFLTEEQKEVMAEYFGYEPAATDLAEKFWKSFGDNEGDDLHSKFRLLWQVMGPLYNAFHEELGKRGLINTGGAYRLTADRLREEMPEEIEAGKVVFAGFNALTSAERRIFDAFASYATDDGDEPFAEYFWDATGPVILNKTSTAGRYVNFNRRRWPEPEWAKEAMSLSEESSVPPEIRAVGVPSNAMQAKVASLEIAGMAGRIPAKDFTDAKVAVVLPDEGLLIPMLYSLPERVEEVNLTMGYPVKLTAVATYVSLLRKLQESRRKSRGKTGYYFKDFETALSHPFSQVLFGREVEQAKEWIRERHMAIVDVEELAGVSPEIADLLKPLPDGAGAKTAMEWLDRILEKAQEGFASDDMGIVKGNVDLATIAFYRTTLSQLLEITEEYGIEMEWRTFLSLADRMIATESVTFEGQPLKGLQVMGLLETRALDFERILILSMNERIMPARRRQRTFISDSLRQAYGLPPVNYAESIFAYYFYRMISRAKEVVLIYDSRSSDGARNGDISRYVLQLKHLYAKGRLKMENRTFVMAKSDLKPSEIIKDEEIMKQLELFRTQGEGGMNLSATALTRYSACQVQFYFQHVMQIKTDEETKDFIDPIKQGEIVHYVMEHIYLPDDKRRKYLNEPILIEEDAIKKIMADKQRLERLVREGVNTLYFHLPENEKGKPLHGSVEMVTEMLRRQVEDILEFDLKQAPFLLYGVEMDGNVAVGMKDGKKVNMRFAIDRLDGFERMADGKKEIGIRIVDYKTGKVHAEAETMQSVFEGEYKGKNLLQLWLYANIFDALPDKDTSQLGTRVDIDLFAPGRAVSPLALELYDVTELRNGKHTLPKIGKEAQKSYEALNGEFLYGLEAMLDDIFSSKTFKPTENESNCSHCLFKSVCWR